MAYRIKNWSRFQHFKNRRPIWIKLYREILDDPEWHNLSGEAAKTLVMLWLIASESGGELPTVERLTFRLRIKGDKLKHSLSTLSHWLEGDDINVISMRYQDATPEQEKEREREGEKERETEKDAHSRSTDIFFDTFWNEYPKRIAKAQAQKAWDKIRPNEELLRKIIVSLKAWKSTDQWRREDGQFIPYPATWLNARRWEDEITNGQNKRRSDLDRLLDEESERKARKSEVGQVPKLFS